jgi:ribosomal protein S18 acetylase RimI-like enzyme
VELLPWDTEFFDVAIARARVPRADAFEPEVAAARDARIDCLYVVVPDGEASAVEAVVRADGLLTALRLVQEHVGGRAVTPQPGVRRATSRDAETIVQLSRSLAESSRFAQDPRFERGRIEEMYRVWALNDLHDGDVFVDANGERGMVTMSSETDIAAIGLVHVDATARGAGLGRALLTAAVARAKERTLRVATDVRNLPALRLYESVGFRARSFDAILHLWLDGHT